MSESNTTDKEKPAGLHARELVTLAVALLLAGGMTTAAFLAPNPSAVVAIVLLGFGSAIGAFLAHIRWAEGREA